MRFILKIIKSILEIKKMFNWKNETTYTKKLEEREKLLKILLEITDTYNSLIQDLEFLISPVFLYSQNKNAEYKLIDERYNKCKEKISCSNNLLNEFDTIFKNYFYNQKKENEIIELYNNLLKNINTFNINIHAFILICEITYSDVVSELILKTKEQIQNNEKIYDNLKFEKLDFEENKNYLKNFYSTLTSIKNLASEIRIHLLNLKF